jgi:chromosome segregation ATPase
MDAERITKQIDWLDEERRKDQTRIGTIDDRLLAAENNIATLNNLLKDHGGEITRLSTLIARMDHYDEDLLKLRRETKKFYEELEKHIDKREADTSKKRSAELLSLENEISEIRKDVSKLPELQRNMTARIEEELRLNRVIDEIREQIDKVGASQEDYTRNMRLLNDGRRQDARRLTDLQGEVTAIRKRADDQRGQLELYAANQKKTENRLNEYAVLETERREALDKFLELQSLRDVERDRLWKDWQTRFDMIENQASEFENQLQALDSTHRTVKRTQKDVNDIAQKVERRIIEISEVQRLAEERFRQEWVTFKADDQKRWTNYTLTMEEQRGETLRQFQMLADRVTNVEDEMQIIQDLIGQMNEQTEKRLQALLSAAHEWVTNYERSVGRA